ncbi:MAG: hypothetical protein ACO1RA_11860 [Planctomycetaceae bacterium]
MIRPTIFAFMTLVAVANCSVYAQEGSPELRTPEFFSDRKRPADYLPYAREFLTEHPKDSRADRILLEMWMTAASLHDEAGVAEAQTRLLLEHPSSLPTRFLLRNSSTSTLQRLLIAKFTSPNSPLDRLTIFRMNRVITLHRAELLLAPKDQFLALCAMVSEDPENAEAFSKQIGDQYSQEAVASRIAATTLLRNDEKFRKLQKLPDCSLAKAYQGYLFRDVFSDEERKDQTIATQYLDQLLRNKQFEMALPTIVAMRSREDDPRLVYWQGIIQAAQGDIAASQATFNELRASFPDSEWARSSDRLSAALDNLAHNMKDHERILSGVLDRLQAKLDAAFAFELRVAQDSRPTTKLKCSCDWKNSHLQLLAFVDDEPELGCFLRPEQSEWFVAKEKKIRRSEKSSFLPPFSLNFAELLGKQPALQFFAFQFSNSRNFALRSSVQKILAQPVLQSRNVSDTLKTQLAYGKFPELMQEENGTKTLRWIAPEIERPEFSELKLVVNDKYEMVSLDFDSKEKKYAVQVSVSKPTDLRGEWPKMETEASLEATQIDFLQFINTAMRSLMSDSSASEQVAGKPL